MQSEYLQEILPVLVLIATQKSSVPRPPRCVKNGKGLAPDRAGMSYIYSQRCKKSSFSEK